jgi:DNA-binding MarR family transcriptional regulator
MAMVRTDGWDTAATVLRLATQLIDAIQDGVRRRGFDDVRPSHGFAFVRISAGDATTADVAEYLGVTKQAAAQLVEYLVAHGYVERRPDPRDGRARLLVLTERGWACTTAAENAAIETVDRWRAQLGPAEIRHFRAALEVITAPGRLRPVW